MTRSQVFLTNSAFGYFCGRYFLYGGCILYVGYMLILLMIGIFRMLKKIVRFIYRRTRAAQNKARWNEYKSDYLG